MPDNALNYSLNNIRDGRNRELERRNKIGLDEFTANVEAAAARHPEISQDVFRDIAYAYQEANPRFIKRVVELHDTVGSVPAQLKVEIGNLSTQHQQEITAKILAKYPEHGAKALEHVGNQAQPESLLTPLVKNFYNSDRPEDKKGVQWGGLLAGLGLGGVAYMLTRGYNKFITIAATIGAVLLGGFIGKKLLDSKDEPLKTPDFHSAHPPFTTADATITAPSTPKMNGVPPAAPEKKENAALPIDKGYETAHVTPPTEGFSPTSVPAKSTGPTPATSLT